MHSYPSWQVWIGSPIVASRVGDKATYLIKPDDVIVNTPPKGNYVPDIVNNKTLEEMVTCESTLKDTRSSQDEASLNNASGNSEYGKENVDSTDEKLEEESVAEGVSAANDEKHFDDKVDDKDDDKVDDKDEDKVDDNDDGYEDVDSSGSDHNDADPIVRSPSKTHTGSSRKKRKSKLQKKSERKSKPEVKFSPAFPTCVPGEKVPVEVCYTFSRAAVMWQVNHTSTVDGFIFVGTNFHGLNRIDICLDQNSRFLYFPS